MHWPNSQWTKFYYSDQVKFCRLLTLLNALWDNFDASFVKEINFLQTIGIDKHDSLPLLKRIDDRYLNKEDEEPVGNYTFYQIKVDCNVVLLLTRFMVYLDDDVMALYISLTERILLGKDTMEDQQRSDTIKQHYDTCLDLLKYRPTCKQLIVLSAYHMDIDIYFLL